MSWSNRLSRVSLICFVVAVGCQGATAPAPAPVALSANALASGNGIASNGIASNGIASNGIASNGIASNGIASNGIASNGIASNGIASNGIASNGIASNGIASNGMLTNGLSPSAGTNGLAENGLVESSFHAGVFKDWFAKDAVYADMVMTYVARCALAEGQSLAYATDTASYAWAGTLGLAPAWASGRAIGEAEQELVSACLAAHTNGFGRHVSISVRGFQADGGAIAVTEDEAASYTFREACYFGNLFTGPGTFMALEPDSLDPVVSTPRGCAAEFGQPTPCAPMVHAGSCADLCQKGADGETWAGCTVNGATYRPLRVFLSAQSVHHCGDGVCDAPAETTDTCPADCAAPSVP